MQNKVTKFEVAKKNVPRLIHTLTQKKYIENTVIVCFAAVSQKQL